MTSPRLSRRTALLSAAAIPLAASLGGCAGPDPSSCIPPQDAGEHNWPEPRKRSRRSRARYVGPQEDNRFWHRALALSPDGSLLAANQERDRQLLGLSPTWGTVIWETATRRIRTVIDTGMDRALAWHPSGDMLACGSRMDIDLTTLDGTLLWRLEGHGDHRKGPATAVLDLAFSPSGDRLASVGTDGTVRLWTVGAQCAPGTVLALQKMRPASVSFSPDGAELAVCGPRAAPRIYDAASGELLRTLDDAAPHSAGLAHTADGTLLIGTGPRMNRDYTLDPIDAVLEEVQPDGSMLKLPAPQEADAGMISPAADGRIAVSPRFGHRMMIWDRVSEERIDLPRPPHAVGTTCFSPEGDVLYAISPQFGPVYSSAQPDAPWEAGFELP